mgnify:CR=1 FL=1
MNNSKFKQVDLGTSQDVLDARAKLKARFGNKARTGGKHSMRRKRISHHRTQTNDDKKLKNGLRKFAV